MDAHQHPEGEDSRVVALPPAREQALPWDVARHLSYLAHLIDDTITIRGVGIGIREFAASFLAAPLNTLVASTADVAGLAFELAALTLADDLDDCPPVALIGSDQEEPPCWQRLDLGDTTRRIPVSLAAAVEAGPLAPVAMVISVTRHYTGSFVLSVYTRAEDTTAGEAYLDGLLSRGRARRHPYRNRTLETRFDHETGLTFRVSDPVAQERDSVVLPAEVWTELDRNVHGLFAAAPRLAAAGLAGNRGILLTGPPGTGKTAVCRVLATELAGTATVVFCDARTVAGSVRDLYREMEHLAPALVVMEDVDLVIGNRRHGGSEALIEFLLALDGAMTRHHGVATVATTNDVHGIDPAARRSARFDRVVNVPAPDRLARVAILERYLADAGDAAALVDAERVAAATDGATGADLRELVSVAVLHEATGEEAISTDLLVRLAGDLDREAHPGLYL